MKDVDGFMVMNPGALSFDLEVRCADHPLWEAMEYRLYEDDFKCTAGRVRDSVIPPCERTITATYLWERMQ